MPETIDILEQQLRERPHYVTKGSYPNFGTSRYLNTPKSVPNTSRKKNKVNLPRIQHSASESRAFATTNLDYVLTPAPANYGTYNSETNSIESSSPLPSSIYTIFIIFINRTWLSSISYISSTRRKPNTDV